MHLSKLIRKVGPLLQVFEPYDGVDPGVEVGEHGEGDDAGDDEPRHVDVPQYVTLFEPEPRRVQPLPRGDVLLGEEGRERVRIIAVIRISTH